MTSPDGASPDGSIALGMFAARQAQTEEQARREATNGAWQGAWNGAQENINGEFASGGYVVGEVGRLDNRIDEIVYGQELAQLATYSTSGVWNKPANCRKVIVDIIGGASGGGRGNSSNNTSVENHGLGGFSGGWTVLEFDPADLPDQVSVVVGAGGMGATSNGTYGAPGQSSSFNGITAGGAGAASYGSGQKQFRIRGGRGGGVTYQGSDLIRSPGATGGTGSYQEGGRGSSDLGVPGESGRGVEVGQVGMGSGGGGGYPGYVAPFDIGRQHGSGGGGGGWPSGPGGGGGAGIKYSLAGDAQPGNGGSGATGAIFVTSYLETATTP